jgi:lipopolysaccharide/colanic/teichoic acid biosynthesis glycosyltransferase
MSRAAKSEVSELESAWNRSAGENAPPTHGSERPGAVRTKLRIESHWARAAKRSLDLAIALPLCVFLLPVLPILIVLAKWGSPGPWLFRQQRVGRDGGPLWVPKVRSMYLDAEERLRADERLYREYRRHGFKLPPDLDPRIAPCGRFLRRSSLDELPQIYLVLMGGMTLVGPRPVLPEELPVLYGSHTHVYLACKPGITGLWQVSGRSLLSTVERVELDLEYARGWTFFRDIRILAATVPKVLRAEGAH